MTVDRVVCAGIDGCRGGWAVALVSASAPCATPQTVRLTMVAGFEEALALVPEARLVAVDMPIGLLDLPNAGGRDCDRAARALLGRRGSSVFSPPARPALAGVDYRDAQRRQGAGLSIQTWNIVPRIREVDAVMTPSLQGRVFEAHPELAFRTLAGADAPLARKASPEGFGARMALLRQVFGAAMPDVLEARSRLGAARVGLDDLADALVLADVARRAAAGAAFRVPPGEPPVDACGLRMEIWF
jgi:predicted RNase H-like nuclease